MQLNQQTIPSSSLNISALTYHPDSENDLPVVILSHGYTASKVSLDLIASYLAQRGYPCLTFDCRGHKLGNSGGSLDSFADTIDDLNRMAKWGTNFFSRNQVVLLGHSMGGLISLASLPTLDSVSAVVAIAVGPRPSHGFQGPVGRAMLALRGDYVNGMDSIVLLESLGTLAENIQYPLSVPSLFIAAKGDVLVKAEYLQQMSELSGPTSTFELIEGSHLDAADRARGTVANWLDRQFKSR